MPGIFPGGGCNRDNAINTVAAPLVVEGCEPLYHCPRCTPRFDPSSANALISEILNLMKCNSIPYDCEALDNLCKATRVHEISGRQTFEFDQEGVVDIPVGTNRNLGSGNFTVPNTFHRDVRVFMEFESTIQFRQQGGGANSQLDIDIQVSDVPDFSGNILYDYSLRVRSFDMPAGTAQFAANPTSARGGVTIQPGGRTFYWRARSTTQGGGNWQLQYTDRALAVTVYGISSHTRDLF